MAWSPSRGAWVFYNVTEDAAFWPMLSSVSISQLHPDGIWVLSCDVEDRSSAISFSNEDEVYVSFDGTKIWAGHIRVPGKGEMSPHGPRLWSLTGQDYTAKLDDSVIAGEGARPRESLSARVTWILSKLDFAITTANVVLPSETVEEAAYEGSTVREALQSVADEKALHFYVDVDKDLHMFRSEVLSAPFDLDDTNPDHEASFPYSEFRLDEDDIEYTNAVRVRGARHQRWVIDEAEIAAKGRQESAIVDSSLTTLAQVIAAGQRRLNQLGKPIIDGSLVCWEPGLRAGMLVPIVNEDWGIDDAYIVQSVDISAVDPHDAAGEAMLHSAIRFTDRRRVGRFPGSGKDKKVDNKPGGPGKSPGGGGSVPGGCCDPVPIEPTQLISWEDCTPAAATTPTQVNTATTNDSGASVTFAIPNGTKTVDHVVVVHMAWFIDPWPSDPNTDDGGIRAAMAAAGWTSQYTNAFRAANVFENVFVRRIDGTEGGGGGWATNGATQTIATTATTVSIMTVAEMVSGVVTSGGVLGILNAAASLDPPPILNPYAANTDVRFYTSVLTRSATITDGPSGYSSIGEESVVVGIHTYRLRVEARSAKAQPEDPSAYTTSPSGGLLAYTSVVGGEVDECSAVGSITPGPTWEGGNQFYDNAQNQPGYVVTDGNIVITTDDWGEVWGWTVTSPPDLPTSLDDFTIVQPFILSAAGSLSDPGERSLDIMFDHDGRHVSFEARFGDAFFGQGVLLEGSSETFEAKDIVEGELHYLKFRLSGGTAYVKLWNANDPEPDWDITTTDLADALDPFEDGLDRLYYSTAPGNDGGTPVVLTLHPPTIQGGALPGESVDWEVVGYGDGSTVQFETAYAFADNTLQVRVDRQSIPDSGIADRDGAAQTFDLTSAPYGDPAEGDAGSATVEARYTRAAA